MERRRFVSALAAAPFLAWAGSWFAEKALGATARGQQTPGQYPPSNPNPFPTPQPPGSPTSGSQGPGSESPGTGMPASEGTTNPNTEFPPVKIDRHAILVQNQKNMRKEVDQLYDLAGQLKKQIDKTDSSEVLSLKMLRKAQEIEKLAKHIQTLAKD